MSNVLLEFREKVLAEHSTTAPATSFLTPRSPGHPLLTALNTPLGPGDLEGRL